MRRTVAVLTKVSPAVKARLETLAKDTNRSEATIAAEAIASYLDARAWQVDRIKRRLAKADSPDGRFVPHEEAMDWFDSIGTDQPLRKPRGRRLADL